MLKIGIFCEDSKKYTVLINIIEQYTQTNRIRCAIHICNTFDDAIDNDFKNLLKSDICIIDFSNHTAAVSLTSKLTERRTDFTWLCTGANLQTLMGLMLMKPSGYIRDPGNAQDVTHLLDRVIRFLMRQEQNRYFVFRLENEYIRISYSDISYFESHAKKVALHLYNSSRVYYITAKLDDIQMGVPHFFMRCHQSFLVNMKQIRSFDKENKKIIVLPNDDVLISRRKYTESKKIYDDFKREYP